MDRLKVLRIETYLRQSALNDVVELEKRVWNKEGYREVNAPMLYFELAYLTNGIVLTAFDEGIYSTEERKKMAANDPWYADDHPIGFLACFADFDKKGPFWFGARMGVDRAYWAKNIGESLVLALYSSAKERDIHRIRWTYDPLQSRNGYIYLQKMGGEIQEIGFNYYSAVFTNDEFNKGISTDRFVVEWSMNTERVRQRMEKGIFPHHDLSLLTPQNILNEIVIDNRGLELHGSKMNFEAKHTPLFVEIPFSQDKLLQSDREQAQDMRNKCRALFMHYLALGYVIREFVTKKESPQRTRAYYRLDLDSI